VPDTRDERRELDVIFVLFPLIVFGLVVFEHAAHFLLIHADETARVGYRLLLETTGRLDRHWDRTHRQARRSQTLSNTRRTYSAAVAALV